MANAPSKRPSYVFSNKDDWNKSGNEFAKSGINYKWIDTSAPDFNIANYDIGQGDYVLGGIGAAGGLGENVNLNGASRLWGGDRGGTYGAVQNFSTNQQASNQYEPIFQQQVNTLKNSLAKKLAALDASKSGINQNYDMQVNRQNVNTMNNRNQFSNNLLETGFGRSTYRNTGLAGINNTNSRIVNDINTYRTNDLNNIESQKAMEQSNLEDTIAMMDSQKQLNIQNLARQLLQQEQDRDFQNEKFDYQKSQDLYKQEWDKILRNDSLSEAEKNRAQQLLIAQMNASNRGGGGSDPSVASTYNKALNNISDLLGDSSMSDLQKRDNLQAMLGELNGMVGTEAQQIRTAINNEISKLNSKLAPVPAPQGFTPTSNSTDMISRAMQSGNNPTQNIQSGTGNPIADWLRKMGAGFSQEPWANKYMP